MRRYVQSLDCGRGSRFLIFGAPTSPECTEAQARLGAMEENYRRLLAEASRSGNERRFALMSAIEQFCSPAAAVPAGSAGAQPLRPIVREPRRKPTPGWTARASTRKTARCSGRRCACAPATASSSRCPPRRAIRARRRRCARRNARPRPRPCSTSSRAGRSSSPSRRTASPISRSPNALSYRTNLDETCACRTPGQDLVGRARPGRDDDRRRAAEIVTPERARELSQPRGDAPAPGPAPAIGPVVSVPFFGLAEGEWREVETADGRRRVRVVAPEVNPAPDGIVRSEHRCAHEKRPRHGTFPGRSRRQNGRRARGPVPRPR